MRTMTILHQVAGLLVFFLLCAGCGKEKIYVYPDGWAPQLAEDTEADGPADLFDTASLDGIPRGTDGTPGEDSVPRADAATDLHTWDFPPAPDMDFPDVIHLDALLPEVAPQPEDTYQFPEVTDDCDPLGLPTQWVGTFDGEITSNIPDFAGYTFNGPVYGEISFEIKCVNQKYLVVGNLDGGTTNCALASGCPFTAQLGGFYNPQTQHLAGQVNDVNIDFSLVIVHGAGEIEGNYDGGETLSGTWYGDKTEIENLALPGFDLAWVDAGGAGTWTTTPVEEP